MKLLSKFLTIPSIFGYAHLIFILVFEKPGGMLPNSLIFRAPMCKILLNERLYTRYFSKLYRDIRYNCI